MKLCKDCRWCKPDWLSLWKRWEFAKCRKVVGRRLDPVGGQYVNVYQTAEYAETARLFGECGAEGKYWEAKA